MSSDEKASVSGGENVVALLPWDLTVRRATARRRAVELLDRKDADAAIRGLSELEAYYVVKDLGLEGALPILGFLEAHQLRALIDLDVWHADTVNLDDLLLWLEAIRESSPEAVMRAARAIDPELLALLFRRRLFVALTPRDDQPEEPDHPVPDWLHAPPEEILPLVQTPDRRFIIAARVTDEVDPSQALDEENRKLILDLVDMLYKDEDLELITNALRLAETDLSSALEEGALRYRNARLEDLGFPELSRALELYAPRAPRSVFGERPAKLPIPDLVIPALHASRFSQGFFREVLETVEEVEVIRRVEGELVALANTAAVADGVEPGDVERLTEVLERVRAYIELALAVDLDVAERLEGGRERLEAHPMRTLFQVGFGMTLEPAHRVRRLQRRHAFGDVQRPLALLGDEDAAVLSALDARRPRFPRLLEGGAAEEKRPFSTPEDLARVGERLAELEELAEAAARLGLFGENALMVGRLDPPLAEERDLDMLIATSAANALLERGFIVRALEAADLEALSARLEKDLEASMERALIAYAERAGAAAGPALARRTRRGLAALQETLSAVGASGVDTRFVGVVVRKL